MGNDEIVFFKPDNIFVFYFKVEKLLNWKNTKY